MAPGRPGTGARAGVGAGARAWGPRGGARGAGGGAGAGRKGGRGAAGAAAAAGTQGSAGAAPPPPDWDLPKAVLLAGCSFAAYLDPLERLGASAGRAPVLSMSNRARVRFLDVDLFQRQFAGRLSVVLLRAEGLAAGDFWGTSDPYCVVSVGPSSARSSTKILTLRPEWGEDLGLLLERMQPEPRLRVRVFDEDIGEADDELGVAEALLRPELLDGAVHSLTLPLQRAGVVGANLTLSLQFEPIPAGPSMRDGDKAAADGSAVGVDGSAVDPLPQEWLDLFQGTGTGDNPVNAAHFRPAAFVDNPDSSTQVWLFSNPLEKQLIVAFRGTEQTDWRDLATDINLVPSSLDAERASSAPLLGFLPNINLWAGQKDVMVHGGFLDAYDSVRRAVLYCVDALAGPGWTVSVTGHSLGGALATLCSYDLAEISRESGDESRLVEMVNFGSPRVGNGAFVAQYDALVPGAIRCINARDIVPTVPRMLGYKHVGDVIVLGESSGGSVPGSDREDAFGEAVAADVIPQLAELWMSSEDSDRAKIQDLLQQELDLFATIQNGSALLEHLEDFYLETLQRSVTESGGPRAGGARA